jgi:radical SAM superfamily enzyme YgiQ (UPF0313 family)
MTYEMQRAKSFLLALHYHSHNAVIIFGGIHATSYPEDCLELADIVVTGEGEETLPELLGLLIKADRPALPEFSQVEGIVYNRDNEIICTPVRQPPTNLDLLPFPKHLPDAMYVTHRGKIRAIKDTAIYKRYARYRGTFLSVLSSRGCPFSCNYCCNSVFLSLYGKIPIRKRTPENVIDEIMEEVKEYKNILTVNFQDDCFLMKTVEWVENFAELYRENIGIPFIIRTTPKQITKEKLLLLQSAGLRWVFMGLQTGSDRINREIYGRQVTSAEFLQAAQVLTELKLSNWYDVILDNPYETKADHLKTIDVLLRTPRPFQLDLFSLDYFPGTQIRERALEDNIPIPGQGEKSYTKPEPIMINRYIRMSATLPHFIIRFLLKIRKSKPGKVVGLIFYYLSLIVEPFIYLWLVLKSNDFKTFRTIKVIKAFYQTAISKLLFRKNG